MLLLEAVYKRRPQSGGALVYPLLTRDDGGGRGASELCGVKM